MMNIFLKRFYAGIIDFLLCNILTTTSMILYIFYVEFENINFFRIVVLQFSVFVVITFIYFLICEYLNGISIGKKIFKIRVEYYKPTMLKKITRPLVKIVTLFLYIIIIPSFFIKEHKLYYDYIFKTYIVSLGDVHE